ncbi:hypothetical protein ACS0TY_030637 [Phlomoides rotata]
METCHDLYRLTHQSPSASSPLPPNLHPLRRRRHQNVLHRQPGFIMPIRGPMLTLRRITAPEYHSRLNHPIRAFRITNQFASHRMAEESKNNDATQGKSDPTTTLNGEKKDKASEKSTPTIPPPPEKPLPGDCCGSGCVRCVWDMYYEELEEYNRLYKADSKVS